MGGPVRKGHALAALILGVIELLIALIVIICSFVVSSKGNISKTATPYWAGLPFVIPGILGIVVGVTKNHCSMIAFMVLNIICFVIHSVSTVTVGIILAIWAVYASATNCSSIGNICTCYVNGKQKTISEISGKNCDSLKSISILLYVIIAFLVIAGIVALAASVVGCVSVCCSKSAQPGTMIIQQPTGVLMQQQQAPPNYHQPAGDLPPKQ